MNEILDIEISSPTRIVFPKENITKLDIAKYYERIAPLLCPHLCDRLVSVIRCHENVQKGSFFKKHPVSEGEDVKIKKVGGEQYFSVQNARGVVKQVQLGTVEFHTWGCLLTNINHPDTMIFDLDPDENVDIKTLRQGALFVKQTLDELGLKSFLKTSGGKGYHVVVPFDKNFSWNKFSNFSKQVALFLEGKHPNLFTSNVRKEKRKNKIYVDYGRNTKGATCVAPFSLRARSGAPVSMPIEWHQLNKFAPNFFNINNSIKFLKTNRPWSDFPLNKSHREK